MARIKVDVRAVINKAEPKNHGLSTGGFFTICGSVVFAVWSSVICTKMIIIVIIILLLLLLIIIIIVLVTC